MPVSMRTPQSKGNFVKFALGGISIFIYEIIVTVLLTELLAIHFLFSYALSLISGLGLLFLYHTYYTFDLNQHSLRSLGRFLSVYFGMYLIAWVGVYIFTLFEYHYLWAIVVMSIACSFLNYEINKRWVFNGKN